MVACHYHPQRSVFNLPDQCTQRVVKLRRSCLSKDMFLRRIPECKAKISNIHTRWWILHINLCLMECSELPTLSSLSESLYHETHAAFLTAELKGEGFWLFSIIPPKVRLWAYTPYSKVRLMQVCRVKWISLHQACHGKPTSLYQTWCKLAANLLWKLNASSSSINRKW